MTDLSHSFLIICFYLAFIFNSCYCDFLTLYNPNDQQYTDVLIKRENDNLTLTCEMRGSEEASTRTFVWNYLGNDSSRQFTVEPHEPSTNSTLYKTKLQLSDSGYYMCSSAPFSVMKYVLVQGKGPAHCARSAFWCGTRCVLPVYVCDGYADCVAGEDELPSLCGPRPCDRHDRLNCSGVARRCISSALCCAAHAPRALCTQHECCDQHPLHASLDGYDEFPILPEDRHPPDDYGFIRSTIYTVTACALIFMVAVVFLVSALCKMHMKRAALRSSALMRAPQVHRFPPCYEAARLLDDRQVSAAAHDPVGAAVSPGSADSEGGFGLTRLSAVFTPMYRQVPTQCYDVEMTDVRSASLNNSPSRTQTRLPNYRSPTFCDLNGEFYFNQETSECGRDLNMATPVEIYRRERRPLTLQVGRFHLSIPRFGRRPSTERRPDTPNVAEINIDDLDFVRLNNETYTLNGRTIRLLGANFENYPVAGASRPPPYNDAMRYKLYGPPPEYLSRDTLVNAERAAPNVDDEARSNVEMPPRYEELGAGTSGTSNGSNGAGNGAGSANNNAGNGNNITANGSHRTGNASNSTGIGRDGTGSGSNSTSNESNTTSNGNISFSNGNGCITSGNNENNTIKGIGNASNNVSSGYEKTSSNNENTSTPSGITSTPNGNTSTPNGNTSTPNGNTSTPNGNTSTPDGNALSNLGNTSAINGNYVTDNTHNEHVTENISSVMDNLPAIDSDVNANDAFIRN